MRRCTLPLGYAALVPIWITVHLLVLPSARWQDVSYLLSSLPPLVLLLRAAPRLPPAGATCCRTLALACGVYAVGNACYLVQAHVLHTALFIAPSDLCFLLSALTVAVALVRVGGSAARWTLGGVVDVVVVLLGFGLLFHTLIAGPVMARQPDLLTLTTTLVYPVVDLLVLLLSARLAVDARRSSAGAALLVYSLLALVSGGTFAVLGLLGTFSTGDPVDALFLARNLGLGLVVLVPGVEALLAGEADRSVRVTGSNALVLPAGLLGPAALLAHMLTGDQRVPFTTAVIGTCLGWAVLARLALTLAGHRRLLVASEHLEAQLQHRVAHDALTGLPNRTLLEQRLLHRLLLDSSSSAAARPGGSTALLYVDLNDFKQVNDTLGHSAGDRLLVQVGQRLTRCARQEDLVARLAGDEFALLVQVPSPGAAQAAQEAAARVRGAIDEPFVLDGHAWHVSASVGVGLVEPGDGLERVLHRADTDMYAHKNARRDRQARSQGLAQAPVPGQDRPTDSTGLGVVLGRASAS